MWLMFPKDGSKLTLTRNMLWCPEKSFRFGIFFFVLTLISPVFIPLVSATGLPIKWKTALSGLLVVGIPQLLTLLAIVFLRKSGFNYIKERMFGFLKRYALPSTVSRTRYHIGLVMFLLPFLFGWLEKRSTNRC